MSGSFVRSVRNDLEESTHRVNAAVVDAGGRLTHRVGDPGRVAFLRSAAKPFQALPLVEDGAADRFGFSDEDLALCCASHNAEPAHVEHARSILARVGLGPEDLECGPHAPMREEAAMALRGAGREPTAIHNNCSGKHAGMLALAVHHGWSTEGYVEPGHPVQQRMLEEISRWTEVAEKDIQRGVDGCGVTCFGLPLERMARAFARFSAAARGGSDGPSRIVGAMVSNPFYVAGTGRLCTDLMTRAGDRVFAKTGAEGLYCAGIPSRGIGVAVKVEDGATRAKDPALLRVLHELGVLDDDDLDALEDHARPKVVNTLGVRVGELRADFGLEAT